MTTLTTDVVTVTVQGITGEIEAKIDTGAEQTSMHADEIKVSGDNVIFTLNGRTYRASLETQQDVSSSDGGVQARPVIRTIIDIEGQSVETLVNLNDRSEMPQKMLIGQDVIRGAGLVLDFTSEEQPDESNPDDVPTDVPNDGNQEDLGQVDVAPQPTAAPGVDATIQTLRKQSVAVLDRLFKLNTNIGTLQAEADAAKQALFDLVKAISDLSEKGSDE